jgi:[ribosomal protein S18]-alanine N-acetyltransferase
MGYHIERMRLEDIPQVQTVESQSFSSPWSAQAYEQDLRNNRLAHYLVLRELIDTASTSEPIAQRVAIPSATQPASRLQRLLGKLHGPKEMPPPLVRPPVIGFAGIWLMVDEAHLVTIAVAPGERGKGLGELLLVSMIDLSCILGATVMTLEVRVSNHVAQSLYRKYGFKNEGVRRRYYTDNGEDALIMTTDNLTSALYQAHYQELKRTLLSRIKVTADTVR